MATLRDIQRRIKAVTNTRQITKAMKMVAAAKLRKAQQRMLEMRPYADKMYSVIANLAAGTEQEAHPLLIQRPRKNAEVLVLTSDRGLCGAFNSNIMKATTKYIDELGTEAKEDAVSTEGLEVSISTVGRKAVDYCKRRDIGIRNSWTGISGNISFENAQDIAGDIIQNYLDGNLDEIYIVYNEFKNVVQQIVRVVKLLPTEAHADDADESQAVDFIYEPSKEQLLDDLLPKNVEIQIFRALLESQASEEAARMSAMENATQAATEMIDSLTLKYNKARQASITAELMDIVGGVEALKG
jgi:F-type H+-transporting ATPase subunit gamma